ncbi:MAG: hypothetical protein AB9Q22_02735 [Candidatus Reddybacter sp.]
MMTVPVERSLNMSSAGIADGELVITRFIETIFSGLLRVPESLFVSGSVVFPRESIGLAEGWGSLAGKSAGIVICGA